jgi:hypothetical protein
VICEFGDLGIRCARCEFFASVAVEVFQKLDRLHGRKTHRNERKEPAAAGATNEKIHESSNSQITESTNQRLND